MNRIRPTLALTLGTVLTAAAGAQTVSTGAAGDRIEALGRATHVIIPQSRSFAMTRDDVAIAIEAVKAHVSIRDQTATTTLEIALRNPSPQRQEAVLLLPVPAQAAVSGFVFEGAGAEPSARLLLDDHARRLYRSIVAKIKDPALLEFAGANLIRSSVFPLPPGGTQRVRLTYENVLEVQGNRIDYALPRSQSLDERAPWTITVEIRSRAPISTVYSPTHELETRRQAPDHVSAKLSKASERDPGAFRVSYLVERADDLASSLFAYPDPTIGGGYFLLLGGVPAPDRERRLALEREVTLVIDRSGSMAGEKLDQVRAAALQLIGCLDPDEGFNIIDYSTTVGRFRTAPVRRTKENFEDARRYIEQIQPHGGTNINDALLEALRQEPLPGTLPIVLFLTDGLPTVGQTAEARIREMVEKGNPHCRRVFTFGVGHDVNVPLLDAVAENTRATSTYLLPGENALDKLTQLMLKLYGPTLSSTELVVRDDGDGAPRVRELHPARMPDLFENDQLVVLGQYRGDQPLAFELTGDYLGKARTFRFEFDLSNASTGNAFVPRLWATRRIAHLADQVRQAGAAQASTLAGGDAFAEPRLRELRDEILRLSAEFGVLSEYTSFLATEGTDLGDWNRLVATCQSELHAKAIQTRSGASAVNQGCNLLCQKQQLALNPRNAFLDGELERVEFANVQQINDRAFFKRGIRWIDSRIVIDQNFEVHRTIVFGTEEYLELLDRMVAEGRNGVLSMQGEILLRVDGQNLLVKNDGC